jgi:hypothetical protein
MQGNVGRTAVRRVAATATALTWQVMGRCTVCTARFFLPSMRLDYPNDLSTNGESALQRWILRFSQAVEQLYVADAGANSSSTTIPESSPASSRRVEFLLA